MVKINKQQTKKRKKTKNEKLIVKKIFSKIFQKEEFKNIEININRK